MNKLKKPYRKFQKRKFCKFCADKIVFIDYKDIRTLRTFLTERGKIIAARMTGNCTKHQRELTRAIKKARNIALIPFIEK
ncbi:MAG TPA: 30S ribosomal protein S18 [Nitrospirae bacterium]|nr:30S ribosomal protein S18 [Nitrospirota bacterium]HDO67606.1 30S ribosomal protein S18 [Nitrospirota bacterium]HDZ84682.1 30S ribosomal protein S18 [Nitrospirota bacterium]HEW81780.1 30S ribosomal protein S18 [Nitrospirota bacterium]